MARASVALATLCFNVATAGRIFRTAVSDLPAWMNPTDPRCGVIKPWSEHKPYEVTVGSGDDAKESQCKACKIRACNSGLPAPGEAGGCQCMSYKDAAGNYATDCKNPINENLPINYTKCGEVRDCDALEGQCVSATFKMDSAATPPWMKGDWKGAEKDKHHEHEEHEEDKHHEHEEHEEDKHHDHEEHEEDKHHDHEEHEEDKHHEHEHHEEDEHHAEKDVQKGLFPNPAHPRCGVIEPWRSHKPYEVTVGSGEDAKESQCKACMIRACNAGLPAPGETGGCQCMSYADAAGNYATDCKNLINENLPINYTKCGDVRDCDALEGQCVSATFKMDSAETPPWMEEHWKGGEHDETKSGVNQLAGIPMTVIPVILFLLN